MRSAFRFAILTSAVFAWVSPAAAELTINPYPNGAPTSLAPEVQQPEVQPEVLQPSLVEEDFEQPAVYAETIDMEAEAVEDPIPINVPQQPELVRGYFYPEPQAGQEQVAAEAPILVEAPIAVEPAVPVAPASELLPTPPRPWQATEGQNIRDILAVWSREAGVEFVWDSKNQFAVLENVDLNTSYENAVRALLDQYGLNQVRPAGSLHIDPSSGEKILVVQDGA